METLMKEASCGSTDPRAAALPGWPEVSDYADDIMWARQPILE